MGGVRLGRKILVTAVLTVAVSSIGTSIAAALLLPAPAVALQDSVSAEPLPPEITWVAYESLSQEAAPNEARRAAAAHELVVPAPEPCPPGTSNYGGTLARFDCLTTYYREDGNRIFNKYGINQRTIGYVVVNNRVGITQPNGNELYGLEARVGDVPIGVNIEVIVQSAPSNEPVAPDQFNLGVVTAYCKGYDGLCPAGVNESIAPGQP